MIGTVAIVGAGTLGARIAYRAATRGMDVVVIDCEPAALDRARRLHGEIAGDSPLPRVTWEGRLPAVAGRDLVIECVPESLEIKRQLFTQLEPLVRPDTVLATNSSSMPVSMIETAVASRERLLNMHFYMTVTRDPTMVELMGGTRTSTDVMAAAEGFARALGIVPLILKVESVGFLFNRVWRAIKRESLQIVQSGVASPEDVDRAWMIHYGQPAGPFGRMDAIGLDTTLGIENVYFAASGDPRDRPAQILCDLVAAGQLGAKSGKGFYSYPDPAYARADFLKA